MKKLSLIALTSLICTLPSPAWSLDCGDTLFTYDLAHQTLDEYFENGPEIPGPRRLVTRQTSKLKPLGSRSFIQAVGSDIDQVGLNISLKYASQKNSKTALAVCKTDVQGKVTKLDEFVIEHTGQLSLPQIKRTYSGLKNQRLSVRLQNLLPDTRTQFEIDLARPQSTGQAWVPNRDAPEKLVSGFVDTHIHQAADLAFAGGWYWGSHREGPLSQRVPSCNGHSHGTLNKSFIPTGNALIDNHNQHTKGYPSFEDWPRWNDIKHQQVTAKWLKSAHEKGLNVAVVSLVNNQYLAGVNLLSGNGKADVPPYDMEAVKRQLLSLKQMAKNVPWYTIVRDPWEARRAIARGELAVFIAVEVSDLLPKSDGPWKEQLHDLYDMGVRSIQLAHQTNNTFSGAALHRDILKTLSQIKGQADPHVTFTKSSDGVHNPQGLTSLGYELLREMIRLNMLIDITHLPLKSQRQIFEEVKTNHRYYPLYNSHTRMADLLLPKQEKEFKEFVTTPETLAFVRKTGGILGLRTGEEPMKTYAPKSSKKVRNNCDGSVRSYIQFYQMADEMKVSLAPASDFNGFITQMAPRYGKDACANAPNKKVRAKQIKAQKPLPSNISADLKEYHEKGLAHMGLLPAMIQDMKSLGTDTSNFERSAETFLQMWERAYDPNRKPLP